MEENSSFIGMGKNPNKNVSDIPLGLGMALSQDVDALSFFGSLAPAQKNGVIQYVQSGQSGQEAKERITNAVSQLKQHKTDF